MAIEITPQIEGALTLLEQYTQNLNTSQLWLREHAPEYQGRWAFSNTETE